ncbi:hypothetical protein P8452_62839 [Trifolium repens]|nr:hypothetical protein P8452_62839 [Trifolium repens]
MTEFNDMGVNTLGLNEVTGVRDMGMGESSDESVEDENMGFWNEESEERFSVLPPSNPPPAASQSPNPLFSTFGFQQGK